MVRWTKKWRFPKFTGEVDGSCYFTVDKGTIKAATGTVNKAGSISTGLSCIWSFRWIICTRL